MSIVQKTPYNQNVTVLNDQKFRLIGDPIEGNPPNKPPYLTFEMRGNHPHIRIDLNNGKKADERYINLALDAVAIQMIANMIENATRVKEPKVQAIAVKRRGFDRATNKPTDPYIYGMIIVGKNSDGCEFIGFQRGNKDSKNFLRLTFNFVEPEFHPIIDLSTGQPIERKQATNLVARGYVTILRNYFPIVHVHTWDYATTNEGKFAIKTASENKNNGGGYNNYANGNNNNQGYTPAPAPQPPKEDDFGELPW